VCYRDAPFTWTPSNTLAPSRGSQPCSTLCDQLRSTVLTTCNLCHAGSACSSNDHTTLIALQSKSTTPKQPDIWDTTPCRYRLPAATGALRPCCAVLAAVQGVQLQSHPNPRYHCWSKPQWLSCHCSSLPPSNPCPYACHKLQEWAGSCPSLPASAAAAGRAGP
jgi:hypothetical protein